MLENQKKVVVEIGGVRRADLHVTAVQGGIGADGHIANMIYFPTANRPAGQGMLENFPLEKRFENKVCKIFIGGSLVHYGMIASWQWQYSSRGEQLQVTSRLDRHMFGDPLQGAHLVDGPPDTYVSDSIVFNPKINNRVVPNRIGTSRWFYLPPNHMFVDTNPSHVVFMRDGRFWSLPTLVWFLCQVMNGQEQYVRNPKLFELLAVLPTSIEPPNHTISFGTRLPDALDELLEQYGFQWGIYAFGVDNRVGMRFWRRGEGPTIEVKLPGYGQKTPFVPTVKVAVAANLAADMTDSVCTQVHILGAKKRAEYTFRLRPAWPREYDAFFTTGGRISDLVPGSDYLKNNPDKERLFRDYVLNETDGYGGFRVEANERHIERVVFNHAGLTLYDRLLFGRTNRRFWPCISEGADGQPAGHHNGYHVEWQKTDGTWAVLNEEVRILENECGIRITTPEIPLYLRKPVSIRITASVDSLLPIEHTETIPGRSHLETGITLRIDGSDEYFHRTVKNQSIFNADIRSGKRKASEAYDIPKMRERALQVLRSYSHPTIKGDIALSGIDHSPLSLVGNSVAMLTGRNVRASATSGFGAQLASGIVGYAINVQENITSLFLERGR